MKHVNVKYGTDGNQYVDLPGYLSFSGAQKLTAYRVGEKVILGPYRERKSFRTLNDDSKPVKLD